MAPIMSKEEMKKAQDSRDRIAQSKLSAKDLVSRRYSSSRYLEPPKTRPGRKRKEQTTQPKSESVFDSLRKNILNR